MLVGVDRVCVLKCMDVMGAWMHLPTFITGHRSRFTAAVAEASGSPSIVRRISMMAL